MCIHADPWEHVLFAGLGGFVGVQYTKFEQSQRRELRQIMGRMDKFGSPNTADAHGEDDE
jgi:hypothetical protein